MKLKRFRLLTDDVIITKDSEAWDDIGVPALVTVAAEDLISGYHLAILRPSIRLQALIWSGPYSARKLLINSI